MIERQQWSKSRFGNIDQTIHITESARKLPETIS